MKISATRRIPILPLREGAIPERREHSLHGRSLVITLTALLIMLAVESLDQTIVGTAMPRVISVLHGYRLYTWGITSYLLASTSIMPVTSKLSDQFGRKGFLLFGLGLFLIGSAFSGSSTTIEQLIIFRVLQGLGAGMGISLIYTVIGDLFTPAERTRWLALVAIVYGLSSGAGPSIGGWLTDHGPLLSTLVTDETRWRWVFYVNVPIGLIALILLSIYLPSNISQRTNAGSVRSAFQRIDVVGALFVLGITICLLLGLTWGGQFYPWNSPLVIGVLCASGVLFLIFLRIEHVVAEPILPLALFRNRSFAIAAIMSFIGGMILLALVTYLPLFLQGILSQTATTTGALITPIPLASVVGSVFIGQLVHRKNRYRRALMVGSMILTVSVLLLSFLTASSPLLVATLCMTVAFFGLGMFFPLPNLIAQSSVPRSSLGVGTGAITYLRAIGQVVGLALVSTIVNNVAGNVTVDTGATGELSRTLPAGASRLGPLLATATNPQILMSQQSRADLLHQAIIRQGTYYHTPVEQTTQLVSAILTALRQSLATGITGGFALTSLFCLALFVVSFVLKEIPLNKDSDA